MRNLFRHLPIVLFISFLNCQTSCGDLVLSIDTAAETLSLTGSTTGQPDSNGSVAWLDGTTGFGAFGAGIVDLSNAFTSAPASAGPEPQLFLFVDVDFALLEVSGANANGSQAVFSGIGALQSVSYADLTNDQKLRLEGLIGNSLGLDSGSGFDPVSVVSAVPEPSSSALVLFLAVGVARSRYRRCRT